MDLKEWQDKWEENSSQFLKAALAWLRLRLARLGKITPEQPATGMEEEQPAAEVIKEEKVSGWFGIRKRPVGVPPKTDQRAPDDEIGKAGQAMADAANVDPPPALVILGQRFGLSQFEREVLLFCAAMEFDTRIPRLCAQAQDDPNRPYPTFALAFTLFDNPRWDALSADGALRFWRLIEINQPGATPLTMSALRADERIVNCLKGLVQLDDRLAPFHVPFHVPFDVTKSRLHDLSASHKTIADAIEYSLPEWLRTGLHVSELARNDSISVREWLSSNRPPLIQLTGTDSISKQQVALEVIARLKRQGIRILSELLPSAVGELEPLAALWQREDLLLPLAIYIDTGESGEGSGPVESQLQLNRFLARCTTLIFLDTREPRTGLGLNSITYEVDKPLPSEQRQAWADALGEKGGDSPGRLAGQFSLNLPAIRQIAMSVLSEIPPSESDSNIQRRLWEACLMRTRPRLDRLAQRIEPKATWDDLILPKEQLDLLEEISSQVKQRSKVYDEWGFRRKMSRGFGISVLFAGESGTGKTMAAEIIADKLNLNLYRIDLSAVVSKYIGETEKNLRRVFDAAEDGGVLLFFDEADALFGKRSEVKDSHDRYANIEINYLLQRMEAYRGLAILATNMKSALDPAFMRRLRFIVKFPFPGPAERKSIWEKVFPKKDPEEKLPWTPIEAPDYDHLARLNLTGGSIHNVALNAAFLAAKNRGPVTMKLILDAARSEFRKLEKPVNEGDFRILKPVGAKT